MIRKAALIEVEREQPGVCPIPQTDASSEALLSRDTNTLSNLRGETIKMEFICIQPRIDGMLSSIYPV